jgi:hypothetical protein
VSHYSLAENIFKNNLKYALLPVHLPQHTSTYPHAPISTTRRVSVTFETIPFNLSILLVFGVVYMHRFFQTHGLAGY